MDYALRIGDALQTEEQLRLRIIFLSNNNFDSE
jgi:hypothetical protein